jgi:hypothetical protein
MAVRTKRGSYDLGKERRRAARGVEMNQVLLLWSQGDWRCELHPAMNERAWLKIHQREKLIVMETVFVGESASRRAEFLRSVFCDPPNNGPKAQHH